MQTNSSFDRSPRICNQFSYVCFQLAIALHPLTHSLSRLAPFGGAGGQHAVEIARSLGIKLILIHRYSSILSAYGLALADREYELQEPTSASLPNSASSSGYEEAVKDLENRLKRLTEDVKNELALQGFEGENVAVEQGLYCRFDGTDTTLMIVRYGTEERWNWVEEFKEAYKKEFGFLLEGDVIVDDVKVN